MSYETPSYVVVEEIGSVEIRRYEAYLVARVAVDGDLEGAGNKGFRILAGYIFGGNSGGNRLAMTTPVTQEAVRDERISMTSPVAQQEGHDGHLVSFMMPSGRALDSLPAPKDARIGFAEVPARQLAAVRYSGRWSRSSYQRHLRELESTLLEHDLVATGEPIWARYDPPFKPPFLRRNEVLTEFRERDTRVN